jgi:signal transduction histidine kinase
MRMGAAQSSGLQEGFQLWRVPLAAGLAAALFSAFVSQSLASREREQFALFVDTSARRLRAEIRAELDSRMHAISILAREWQDRLLPRRGDWESDVRLILSQSPGLHSIAWVEASGEHSWAYPPEGGLPAIDVDALRTGGAALRRPVMLEPVLPKDGVPRLRILAPLRERGALSGWLAATYSSRELFSEVLASVDTTFTVDITAGKIDLYRAPSTSKGDPLRPVSHTTLVLPGDKLKIEIAVEPSDEMIAAAHSRLPGATLAGGLALSVLATLALFQRNVAKQQARALEGEIERHQRTEAEVRRLNTGLEERVRERTSELERSNDELQKFASFLSHELRQPLGTQMIWIELLESQAASVLDETSQRNLEKIRSMALRMSDLISAQIAITQQPASRAASDRVDLGAVVREAIGEVGPEIEVAGAKVAVGALPLARGDAGQLAQLFRNLLDNALKYRRDGVQCEIRVSAHESSDPAFAGGCEITVEDNGRGFAPEDAERIFAASERLDAEGPGGQGLGLALCRKIVDRHGGGLRAEGRPGEGAVFRIVLPEYRIYR